MRRTIVNAILFGVTLLGVVVALYGAYTGWYGPAFASAIASSGLVLATIISLITTRDTLEEQRLAREQQAKPLLRLIPEKVTLGSYSLMIENVGNGPAKNIDVSVKAIGSDLNEKISPEIPLLASGESVAVSVGMDDVPEVGFTQSEDEEYNRDGILGTGDEITEEDIENIDEFVMNGSCTDILNKDHPINSTYYTKYLNEGMAQYGTKDMVGQLEEIKRSIDRIG